MTKFNRARAYVAAGVFAVAAATAPLAIGMAAAAPQDVVAGPPCLAWMGNKEDGKCLSYSNGNFQIGTPWCNGGNGPDSGCSSGPLLPGTSINRGIG